MAGACGGETPARLIRRVVLASASRSGGARRARGNHWPVLRSAARATPVPARNHLLRLHPHHAGGHSVGPPMSGV